MNHVADFLNQLDTAVWNDIDPAKCPCRGSGWLLSDYDTWHRCRTHGIGVPHPEDEHTAFDFVAHDLAMHRKAYAHYRDAAKRAGFKGDFKVACRKEAGGDLTNKADWVKAASLVASEWVHGKEEADAHRNGFSSALEARLHDEAVIERMEAERFGGWC